MGVSRSLSNWGVGRLGWDHSAGGSIAIIISFLSLFDSVYPCQSLVPSVFVGGSIDKTLFLRWLSNHECLRGLSGDSSFSFWSSAF